MKNYRYVEFVDGGWTQKEKSGYIYLMAASDEEESFVKELGLEKIGNGVTTKTRYRTSIAKMGKLGWELAFVTPCGNVGDNSGCMIQNAYIFRKEN